MLRVITNENQITIYSILNDFTVVGYRNRRSQSASPSTVLVDHKFTTPRPPKYAAKKKVKLNEREVDSINSLKYQLRSTLTPLISL